MKFNRLFLILVGALALFSSCSDSDDDTDNGGKNLVSTAKAFSVSDTKKVIFSSGNLQYQPSTGKWRFAEHQYDFIGEDNKNISATYTGWIDLLGWGTGDEPAKVSTSGDDYPVFSDWGTKVDDGKWFTLSTDEWQYFIDHHANKWTTVNGVAGRLFLPDDSKLSIDAGWSDLEAAGAVFLPAAGYRSGANLYLVGSNGQYWASTPDGTGYADYLFFYSDGGHTHTDGRRFYGLSVRLVRLAQ